MSQIDTSNINESFPVPGNDNDSIGFRNNFGAIKTALENARSELADLQANAIVKTNLGVNSTLDNDMNENEIFRGKYRQFNEIFANRDSDVSVNLSYGPVQEYTLYAPTTYEFLEWPSTGGQCSKVRLIFSADAATSGAQAITFTGNIVFEKTITSPLTVDAADGTIKVYEAWSINGGDTIYIQFCGEY